ncbi:MAG: DUF6512 family protein [Clostridia bacterium]|nr:DUF6512 family protein [Clostridia bacterium]
MTNKKLFLAELIGLIWGVLASFLFHFLYDLTNQNIIISLIAPINESVWEHTKLLVFPFLIYAVIECFVLKPKHCNDFWSTKLIGATLNIPLLAIIYYSYSGVLGEHFVVIDIIIALILVTFSYFISYKLLSLNHKFKHKKIIVYLGLTIIFAFFVFTFYPPHIGWFASV